MAVLKCKMCGGNIKITQDPNIGICESCGNKITISNVNNEEIINLFERALSTYGSNISNTNTEQLVAENISTSNLLIYNANNDILDYIFNIILNKKPDKMKLLMYISNNDTYGIYDNIEHLLIPIIKEKKMFLGALRLVKSRNTR